MTPSYILPLALVATIVAGEVGSTVPGARLPVACTVIEDHRRGRDLHARWYGRATPTAGDLEAARLALQGHCTHLPYFRFFGNARDLEVWIRLGYVHPTDDIWYWTRGSWTAVGIPEQAPGQLPFAPPPAPSAARGACGACGERSRTKRTRTIPRHSLSHHTQPR